MSKKTKFEKPENKKTKVNFTLGEVQDFAQLGYAAMRRNLYLEKVMAREPNPRMVNGLEVLSNKSMVAEIDMSPLSTRQQMARFIAEPLNGDGFDADTNDESDLSFDQQDRMDNPPTQYEIRVRRLEQKLDQAYAERDAAIAARLQGGDTPVPTDDANRPKTLPASNTGPETAPKTPAKGPDQ